MISVGFPNLIFHKHYVIIFNEYRSSAGIPVVNSSVIPSELHSLYWNCVPTMCTKLSHMRLLFW